MSFQVPATEKMRHKCEGQGSRQTQQLQEGAGGRRGGRVGHIYRVEFCRIGLLSKWEGCHTTTPSSTCRRRFVLHLRLLYVSAHIKLSKFFKMMSCSNGWHLVHIYKRTHSRHSTLKHILHSHQYFVVSWHYFYKTVLLHSNPCYTDDLVIIA